MTDVKEELGWEELFTVETLQHMEAELQDAQKSDNIPMLFVGTQFNQVSQHYITYILKLERMCHALVSNVAQYNAEELDSGFVMAHELVSGQLVSVDEPTYAIQEAVTSRQKELGVQCLKSLLMFPDESQAIVDACQQFKTYAPLLDNKFLLFLIRKDCADALDFVLTYGQCSLDTLLSPEDTVKLHAGLPPTVLEAIIKHEAADALMLLTKKYPINFLMFASDGRLLASHVFALNFDSPLRVACVRGIPAFSDDEFYQDALITLQEQPRFLEDMEVAYAIHKHAATMQQQDRILDEPLQKDPDVPYSKKALQLDVLQQRARAVGVEVERAVGLNKRFRNVLANVTGDLYLQLKMFLDINPAKATQCLNNMRPQARDEYVMKLSTLLYHVEALIHFGLPESEQVVDRDVLPPSARAKVRAYHALQLQAAGALKTDPFELAQSCTSTTAPREYTLAYGMQQGQQGHDETRAVCAKV